MAPREGSASDARVRAEVAAFLSSPHAQPFLADRAGAGEVARAFLDVCYGTLGLRPDLLDEEHLREALLEFLPPRLDPNERAAKDAVALVRALLDHSFDTHPNDNSWKLGAIFDEAATKFPGRLESRGGSGVVADTEPITRPGSKLGRNDPCPCGSGKKWKKCCGKAA